MVFEGVKHIYSKRGTATPSEDSYKHRYTKLGSGQSRTQVSWVSLEYENKVKVHLKS